eukprot:COSAG02_NODE_144_length_34086_cov_65.390944_2_plen_83_part_00
MYTAWPVLVLNAKGDLSLYICHQFCVCRDCSRHVFHAMPYDCPRYAFVPYLLCAYSSAAPQAFGGHYVLLPPVCRIHPQLSR